MARRCGESQKGAKLTEQQVRNIRKAAGMGINEHYLAAIYHVSRINIWSIVKRQSWSHVE